MRSYFDASRKSVDLRQDLQSDNGGGFDPHDIPGPAQGHFGLQGIRERISGRNGDMTVESAPGKGTKITVAFVPDEKDEDEP